MLLAMFPDVQEKAYQETKMIDDLIDNDPTLININILDQMEYIHQVIQESLRLFPSAPMIGRLTTGEVHLKTRNLVIPEGVNLVIAVAILHRNKKIWGLDADKFDPDRFSRENKSRRHPHAFIGFSNGPRDCVGVKFAYLSLKMVIYKIIRAYRLETDEKFEDVTCVYSAILRKAGGWRVRISSRS